MLVQNKMKELVINVKLASEEWAAWICGLVLSEHGSHDKWFSEYVHLCQTSFMKWTYYFWHIDTAARKTLWRYGWSLRQNIIHSVLFTKYTRVQATLFVFEQVPGAPHRKFTNFYTAIVKLILFHTHTNDQILIVAKEEIPFLFPPVCRS